MKKIKLKLLAAAPLLAMFVLTGCANHAAKPEAAAVATGPTEDEKHFVEIMDKLYKLRGEAGIPAAEKQALMPSSPAAEPTPPAPASKTVKTPKATQAPPSAAATPLPIPTTPKIAEPPTVAKAVEPPKNIGTAAVAAAVAVTAAPAAVAKPAEPSGVSQTPAAAVVLPQPVEAPAAEPAPPPTPAQVVELPPPLEAAVSASTPSFSPQDIKDTIKLLTTHPRVNYHVASGKYSYYAGGLVNAEYDTNSAQLLVSGDSGKEAVQCRYSSDGRMISKLDPVPSSTVAACNTLIKSLVKVLAH